MYMNKYECIVCRNLFKRVDVLINWDKDSNEYYICAECLGDW